MLLPRLTTALRAFSGVSPDVGQSEEHVTHTSYIRSQKLVQQEDGLSFQKLEQLIFSTTQADERKHFKELQKISRDIVGPEANPEEVEACTVLLFETFYACEVSGPKEHAKLKKTLGSFPPKAAGRACQIVNVLRETVEESTWETLVRILEGKGAATQPKFGDKIRFNQQQPEKDGSEFDWLLDPGEEVAQVEEFSMHYSQPKPEEQSQKLAAKTKRQKESKNYAFDSGWLRRQLERIGTSGIGIAVDDLCSSVFDSLTSSKANEALQEELFNLLGFEHFELIQQLLMHRSDIVDSLVNSGTKDEGSSSNSRKQKGSKGPTSRPQYGCQVIVQSEKERQLQKAFRKEDKRLDKKRRGDDIADEWTFDPDHLKNQREVQLLMAASIPSLGPRRQPEKQNLPFVFDALASARQNSAFIAGSKMLLPEGIERENNKTFEEVYIPPTDPAPAAIFGDLIKISMLDDVGRIAFNGMKSLNRIQSVVFDTAYNSNDNLLVCAPTGAGKTNIAMLTVVNLLKQHMQQGVIKKDEFKIVYVAPMKALAAEMTRNFGGRLEPLGIAVKELTGDMQLSKSEIMKTQMLVTTPEKWDVVTRKSTGDVALTQIVKLLIIDEVHLLHDERGAVIESLVARTLRQVESSQRMIRILGLSATLPNYMDVAHFLGVNPQKGLFFFDGRFRPVPLAQTFIGIKSSRAQQIQDFNCVCFEKVVEQVQKGHQVMVFVHARNETVRTASTLNEMAKNHGKSQVFSADSSPQLGEALKQISRSRNKQLKEMFPDGFGIHHAGMLRQDRNLVERYFADGLIKCLVCTATLAWGVNLPAHAVIIKGTQIYDAKKGMFVDLSILDVQQIFGRAGRPQYDTFGHGTILTTHEKLSHYLALLTQQNAIESQFQLSMKDNMNAEISLGTVANVDDAVRWLSYTYLFVRMLVNPMVYGITQQQIQQDPHLEDHRRKLVIAAGRDLDKARMVRFEERTGYFYPTDLGRTASNFYIKFDTVEVINELMREVMTEDKILELVSKSSEFEQVKVRDEELDELDTHQHVSCRVPVAGGSENSYGKVNILLQAYISRSSVNAFSLVSDQGYVAQNSARIVRGLFEVALRKNWPIMATRLLTLSKIIEKRQWGFESPLRQFGTLPQHVVERIENRKLTLDTMREMPAKDLGLMVHHDAMGRRIKECLSQLPSVSLEASIQPITRTVLRVRLLISAKFRWNDKIHGNGEPFWIWVEDPDNNHMYHHEYFILAKKHVQSKEAQELVFTIPIFEPLPTQYYVKAISDRWLGSETLEAISFKHLILPERHAPHTELLDLQPLPITALDDVRLEQLYRFTHFNPIQTQIFHTLYYSDVNVLLGAPTGSGKTVAAELAIFRVFRQTPGAKCVYIAPLKALVRERMEDWKIRIEEKLGKKVVELTGDVAPDMQAVAKADLIVTTPEKWDGVSRSWQTRSYVKAVNLLVIDEIHLLGDDRGPVLEVIVSRTNFISSHTNTKVRVVGLSTALANARDLADWLGIKQMGLFNFRPSVRPVPLEVHIQGFPGKHYCPRMATMNKPCFQGIRSHSPEKPVLIFVSSRRQTRLTALDLIAFLATETNPKQWLHMPEAEIDHIIGNIRENNLKLTLAFGIGLHHAGLHEKDRKAVEELFVNSKIQVLVATSTLAWGVNFPAHLVIVKGTEFYDGKTKRYVDFPITDVLQMMGRAGRPQFDDQGKALILVHDIKKHFYKKFLYEPFPVESNLLEVMSEHLNAEIVAGTITSKQDALDYITWTYFFRRLVANPTYYQLEDVDHDSLNKYLSKLVEKSVLDLEMAYCLQVEDDNRTITPLTLGRIASFYYLHHSTVRTFHDELTQDSSISDLITVLANAFEYSDLPVRHNEDQINQELAASLPLEVNQYTFDSSNTKTHLLLQAHFCQTQLPSSDYLTDTKSVLDQAIRILQAMLDVCADQGWLVTSLRIIQLIQMVIQGRWVQDSSLLTLPCILPQHLAAFRAGTGKSKGPIECLPQLLHLVGDSIDVLTSILQRDLNHNEIDQVFHAITQLPVMEVKLKVTGWWEGGPGKQEERHVTIKSPDTPFAKLDWIVVHADQEYVLHVDLRRLNKIRRKNTYASAPRFPKPKEEGWILVLGEIETKEVLALKRVGYVRGRRSVPLSFFTPESVGRVVYTLYVMSDSYLGLDQQYDVCLDVISASIEAQVNTEVIDGLLDDDSY